MEDLLLERFCAWVDIAGMSFHARHCSGSDHANLPAYLEHCLWFASNTWVAYHFHETLNKKVQEILLFWEPLSHSTCRRACATCPPWRPVPFWKVWTQLAFSQTVWETIHIASPIWQIPLHFLAEKMTRQKKNFFRKSLPCFWLTFFIKRVFCYEGHNNLKKAVKDISPLNFWLTERNDRSNTWKLGRT